MICEQCKTSHAPHELRDGWCLQCWYNWASTTVAQLKSALAVEQQKLDQVGVQVQAMHLNVLQMKSSLERKGPA